MVTLRKARWEGAPCVQVDLFGIEGRLIVEHGGWAEVIGPEEEWVCSGEF